MSSAMTVTTLTTLGVAPETTAQRLIHCDCPFPFIICKFREALEARRVQEIHRSVTLVSFSAWRTSHAADLNGPRLGFQMT
jgi:hypothetical protein